MPINRTFVQEMRNPEVSYTVKHDHLGNVTSAEVFLYDERSGSSTNFVMSGEEYRRAFEIVPEQDHDDTMAEKIVEVLQSRGQSSEVRP